mgnify:CR=1 FL=1
MTDNNATLNESFVIAKKRYQPYINLANQVYSLEDIFSIDSFKKYKELELKSLYFRSDKITLDVEFAKQINELVEIGVREIFIFCDQEQSQLNSNQFNDFLKANQIRINFKIAQISEHDLESIKQDSVGKKDILGFKDIVDNKIIYRDGVNIELLNDKTSDLIILDNHSQYKQQIISKHDFLIKEPEYITNNSNPSAIKRIKDPSKITNKAELEVSMNIDFNAEIDKSAEIDNELDMDLEQLDNKFSKEEALEQSVKIARLFFYENHIKEYKLDNPYKDIRSMVESIFKSDTKIKFISNKALDLLVKNYFFFKEGIDTQNMPIGLAFKDHLIFASSQRLSSMPINEFTIKMDEVRPTISNPLEYSWLSFATQASISLNDIYGTEVAPTIYGYDQHPILKDEKLSDIMLDIPYNNAQSEYDVFNGEQISLGKYRNLIENKQVTSSFLPDLFPAMYFSNISESDLKRLQEIHNNLAKRGISEIFNNIIGTSNIKDGGFLLEEKASLFLEKLFEEIFPLSANSEKLDCFKQILETHKFKDNSNIEDVFEAFDGFYKKFQEFLIKQEISAELSADLLTKALDIVKIQAADITSFKTIMGRLINIIELSSSSGGNLKEQLEYLSNSVANDVLKDPSQYEQAKELGLNVIHKSAVLDKAVDYQGTLSAKALIDSIFYAENSYNNFYANDSQLTASIRYLSTIPAHQRPSIDTYAKYFYSLGDNLRSLYTISCNSRLSDDDMDYQIAFEQAKPLQTVEYVLQNVIGYQYPISTTDDELTFHLSYKSPAEIAPLEDNLGKKHIIFSVEENEIYFIYQIDEMRDVLKLSEQEDFSNEQMHLLRAYFEEHKNISDNFYQLKNADITYVIVEANIYAVLKENAKLMELIIENSQDSKRIYIKSDGGTYDLYSHGHWKSDDLKLDKSAIILPTVLEEKIKQWIESGKKEKTITLFPSEIAGTYFEADAGFAHRNSIDGLVKLAGEDLTSLEKLVAEAKKGEKKDTCYAATGIVTETSNLVTHFTTRQAYENVKLLSLNIITSVGKYYDKSYPDQEFSSFVSLFNILFSEVKIYDEVKIGDGKYKSIENFNYGGLQVAEGIDHVNTSKEIKDKEEQHKKIINNFISVYRENQEFNFIQVVALGLVATHLGRAAELDVTNNAKNLLQYNEHFVQMLRILLSTPISEDGKALSELNARVESIARNINYLSSEHEGVKIHQLLTRNGKHPENLEFFAACFAKDSSITYEQISYLILKLENLDKELKEQLLEAFATTKLPFEYGQIIDNNFPVISLERLDDVDALNDLINKAKNSKVSYEFETRFNEDNLNAIVNAKVDFTPLEDKYQIHLPANLKDKSYAEIRSEIIGNKDFIKDNFAEGSEDPEVIKQFSLDIVYAMIASISNHDTGWQDRVKQMATLLYNKNKPLKDQYLEIEYNKRNLDKLLKSFSESYESKELFDNLLRDPGIPHDTLMQALTYLNHLNQADLSLKGYSLTKLLKSASNEVIGQHFESFKIATDAFIKSDIGIDLDKLYLLLQNLSAAKYSPKFIKKIISYCIDNLDYSVVSILSQLDGKADNIEKILDWITSIMPSDIHKLSNILGANIKDLLAIKNVDKIQIISDIAFKLEKNTKEGEPYSMSVKQYQLVVKQIMTHDLVYAKLIKSYLCAPNLKTLSQEDRVKMVLDNINSLDELQIIFSNYNLARFNFNQDRLVSKTKEIIRKNSDNNTDEELSSAEQNELMDNFVSLFEKAKTYKELNYNQIHARALELKHSRMLSRDQDSQEIINIDLEYIALSFELLYRETGKFPRDTQILSLLNSVFHKGNIIEEISTGQGKSLITALHAAYLSFIGQTVDVVSSSKPLAKEGLQEFSGFYDGLGIVHSNSIITASSEIDQYKKGGINYATASDLALFRSNRDFHKYTTDLALNADVSLICDEVDYVLTSAINYKLAVPLINTNQEETRALLSYILEFVETDNFKNEQVSKQNDVENLTFYLKFQFQKYDSSFKYPLNIVQINDLKNSNDLLAKKLYSLHRALDKSNKYTNQIFDKLLDASVMVRTLENGIHYVVLNENLDKQDELLHATPIIKDQPSKGTVFGDGVQALLHLLIEQAHPELKSRFDVSLPSSTIFNVSPKNFFDYYIMTGGRIIGLTGTAGNAEEIEEFRLVNKMLTFHIPDFEESKKIIKEVQAENTEKQLERMLDIVSQATETRPMIIFCETTKAAEQVFELLKNSDINHLVQLSAASPKDTWTVEDVLGKAGKDGYLTVTTPMLGRGIDFTTTHIQGFLSINLCTSITLSSLNQIYGRVARNGVPGEAISIFNREIFGQNIASYMDEISHQEKEARMKSQPLTDILLYFNGVNQDNTIGAIRSGEFISNAWKILLREGDSKTYAELRDELIALVKQEYPELTKGIDQYLARIDTQAPAKTGEITDFTNQHYNAQYVSQNYNDSELLYSLKSFQTVNSRGEWSSLASGVPMSRIETPRENNAYQLYYSDVYRKQVAVLTTHAFTIEEVNFNFYDQYNYKFSQKIPYSYQINYSEMIFFLDKNELYCQIAGMAPLKISAGFIAKDGIPKNLFVKIVNSLKAGQEVINLSPEEKNVIHQFIIANHYIQSSSIKAEGSQPALMVSEFKKSFSAYKKIVNSSELEQITNLIDNFNDVKEIDVTKLEYGKYQAIDITTLVDTNGSHAETMITDGKFLFWINRGSENEGEAGIKLFRIVKGLEEVKSTLEWLKTSHSQSDTRVKIYSLLREDDDKEIPKHALIEMKDQVIGNCGWTQVKGILWAAAIVGRLGELNSLPDEKSQEWQKAVQDAGKIYKNFVKYDLIKRAEAAIFTIDEEFNPLFLGEKEQDEINLVRKFVEQPISYEVLTRIRDSLEKNIAKFDGLIYEQQAHVLLDRLKLEVAIDSKMGQSLRYLYGGRQSVYDLLLSYQQNDMNDFKQLDLLYKNIKDGRIENAQQQGLVLGKLVHYIIDNEYNIANFDDFANLLTSVTKECSEISRLDEYCIIDNIF